MVAERASDTGDPQNVVAEQVAPGGATPADTWPTDEREGPGTGEEKEPGKAIQDEAKPKRCSPPQAEEKSEAPLRQCASAGMCCHCSGLWCLARRRSCHSYGSGFGSAPQRQGEVPWMAGAGLPLHHFVPVV